MKTRANSCRQPAGGGSFGNTFLPSSGSESTIIILFLVRIAKSQPDKSILLVLARVEHPAVLNVCAGKYWERQGYRVTYLGVDNLEKA